MYIYEQNGWPCFSWDDRKLASKLFDTAFLLGTVSGKMKTLQEFDQKKIILANMTEEIIASCAIEGEHLNFDEVRSSVARMLKLPESTGAPASSHVGEIVEMMTDARSNYKAPLTLERMLSWHARLFPDGENSLYRIKTGEIRDDGNGPMQVVSSRHGSEEVYFQAPPAELLPEYLKDFLKWFERDEGSNPLIRAAIAHLWFLTLHPFEDGNGRIARVITEMMLARADNSAFRFYNMSNQIFRNRNDYYKILERTQKGNLEISQWIGWFLDTLKRSLNEAMKLIDQTVRRKSSPCCWTDLKAI
ncbi:MAG: Fic family protein [Succinivibrionaceae bacterium]|nr:Fic family protein [Succinivibrionaceae bacterium]